MTHPKPLPFDDSDDDDDTLAAPPGPLGASPLTHDEAEALLLSHGADIEEPDEAALQVLRRDGEVVVGVPDDGTALPVATDEQLDVRMRRRRR